MGALQLIDEASHFVSAAESAAVENDDGIALTVELVINFGVAGLSAMRGRGIIAVGSFA